MSVHLCNIRHCVPAYNIHMQLLWVRKSSEVEVLVGVSEQPRFSFQWQFGNTVSTDLFICRWKDVKESRLELGYMWVKSDMKGCLGYSILMCSCPNYLLRHCHWIHVALASKNIHISTKFSPVLTYTPVCKLPNPFLLSMSFCGCNNP